MPIPGAIAASSLKDMACSLSLGPLASFSRWQGGSTAGPSHSRTFPRSSPRPGTATGARTASEVKWRNFKVHFGADQTRDLVCRRTDADCIPFSGGRNECTRYLRLDRLDHPGCERGRRVLHRRLAARTHRKNPWPSARAGRDGGRLGHLDLWLCAVANRAGLGLCRCTRLASEGAAAMMIAIMAVYLVLLFALVRFGIVTFNLFWKCSPFIVLLLLNLLLFIPMGWGAPQGAALVVRNAVSIIPNVAGEVIDVPVEGNTALKAGDVLFRIDPVPYEAPVRAIEAQLKLSATRLAQMTQLFERDSGRGFDVEQRQSEVDQLKAQLESAKWNLDKTTVRAPADGYVTNLALRKGARGANLPL